MKIVLAVLGGFLILTGAIGVFLPLVPGLVLLGAGIAMLNLNKSNI